MAAARLHTRWISMQSDGQEALESQVSRDATAEKVEDTQVPFSHLTILFLFSERGEKGELCKEMSDPKEKAARYAMSPPGHQETLSL